MKYDIGVLRTVVDPDITSDQHTAESFTEAGINFTVYTTRIPGPAKKLVPFDPEIFESPESNEST